MCYKLTLLFLLFGKGVTDRWTNSHIETLSRGAVVVVVVVTVVVNFGENSRHVTLFGLRMHLVYGQTHPLIICI